MTVSTRYAVPLAVVLAAALVPTLIHSYAGVTVDDGRRARDVNVRIAETTGVPTSRKPDWVKRRLASDDWQERRYSIDGREVVLFIARSYDPKALYHHPELALAYGIDFESRGVVDLKGVPSYALAGRTQPDLAMYALHSNDSFVADPIRFQLRNATTGLFRGRTPMTLFFALQRGVATDADLTTTGAARVLGAATTAFVAGNRSQSHREN